MVSFNVAVLIAAVAFAIGLAFGIALSGLRDV
jgi:hypothetical protein